MTTISSDFTRRLIPGQADQNDVVIICTYLHLTGLPTNDCTESAACYWAGDADKVIISFPLSVEMHTPYSPRTI